MTSARKHVDLEITPKIIERAKRRDSGHCLIADALRVTLPEATRVSVDLQTIRFSLPGERRRYIYLTPALAQAQLVAFDQGIEPIPTTIRLGRPVQIISMRGPAPSAESNAKKRADKSTPLPSKGRTVTKDRGNGEPPTVLGGHAPPSAALSNRSGRRREFGLRSLGR